MSMNLPFVVRRSVLTLIGTSGRGCRIQPAEATARFGQGVQHRFQKARALAVLGGRIEQIRDNARQTEFVLAQVFEDVEPG